MQLHGGSCVDSFKAVVLGLSWWWEDVLRKVYWSWKGVGITLGSKLVLEGCGVTLDSKLVLEGCGVTLNSKLVLEGCEHLGEYSSEVCMTISSWSVTQGVVGGCTQRDILVLEGCGDHFGQQAGPGRV